MPIYEFRCDSCDEQFEALVRPVTESLSCPTCGSTATRVLSAQAAPMRLVKGPGERRRQERRNARLRDRAKAGLGASRRRVRQARDSRR